MARINPDPYAGGHLFALVNRVTCLLDTEDEVMATVKALEEDGVAADDIDIFTGDKGVRCLDLSGREHGRAVHLLRKLEAALGAEGETNHRIEAALRKGATLLCVRIHTQHVTSFLSRLTGGHADGDGATRIDEKARALRILKARHAHEIHYWGPWACEDVASS